MQKTPLYFQLTNNTAVPQAVSLFNSVKNSQSLLGLDGWDLTGELANAALYNGNVLAVIARSTAGYELYTYTSAFVFTDISQVVAALNTLGLGTFTNTGNVVQVPLGNYVFSSIALTNLYPALPSPNIAYNYNGSLVYDTGYTTGGVGNFTLIDNTVPFWRNNPVNTVNGPMNRNARWNNPLPIPVNQQVGVYFSYYSPTGGTVYLGLSGDNLPTVYLNNQLALQFDVAAMGTNIGNILGPAYNNGQQAFAFWHIFPFTLVPGYNIFQVQNFNTGGVAGGMGCEIYNNTASQIINSTSYANLNLLFATSAWTGNLF